MFDRIFAPALTFVMLIGGTAAMVCAMFYEPRPEAGPLVQATPAAPIVLETVVITNKRPRLESRANDKANRTAASTQAAEGRGVLLRRAQD